MGAKCFGYKVCYCGKPCHCGRSAHYRFNYMVSSYKKFYEVPDLHSVATREGDRLIIRHKTHRQEYNVVWVSRSGSVNCWRCHCSLQHEPKYPYPGYRRYLDEENLEMYQKKARQNNCDIYFDELQYKER